MISITVSYVLFDIFNSRKIPTLFILGSLIVAVIFALLNQISLLGSVIAFWIIILASFLAWLGIMGLADGFLLATLALLMPYQSSGVLVSQYQYGLPFILTLISNLMIPVLFYLAIQKYRKKSLPFTPAILVSLMLSLLVGNLIILFL